jgi:gamma-glutamyl phosphate reductase
LQKLEPEERAQLLRSIGESLKHNQNELFKANKVDLDKAKDQSKLNFLHDPFTLKKFFFENMRTI